ncbi:hypothetical protein RB601_004856 [Gaeumannomyces tritici]
MAKRQREPSGPLSGGYNAKKTASANVRESMAETGPSSASQIQATASATALPIRIRTWLTGDTGSDSPHPHLMVKGRRSTNGDKIKHRPPPPPTWADDRPTNGGPVGYTLPPVAEHSCKSKQQSNGVDPRGAGNPERAGVPFDVVLRGGEIVCKTVKRGFSHIGSRAVQTANRSRANLRSPSQNRWSPLQDTIDEGSDTESTSVSEGTDGDSLVEGSSGHSGVGQGNSNEEYAVDIEAVVGRGSNSATKAWPHMARNASRLATLCAILMTGLLHVVFHTVSYLACRSYDVVGMVLDDVVGVVLGEGRHQDEEPVNGSPGQSGGGSGSNGGLFDAAARQEKHFGHGRADSACLLPASQALQQNTSRQDGEGHGGRRSRAGAASRGPRRLSTVREE